MSKEGWRPGRVMSTRAVDGYEKADGGRVTERASFVLYPDLMDGWRPIKADTALTMWRESRFCTRSQSTGKKSKQSDECDGASLTQGGYDR